MPALPSCRDVPPSMERPPDPVVPKSPELPSGVVFPPIPPLPPVATAPPPPAVPPMLPPDAAKLPPDAAKLPSTAAVLPPAPPAAASWALPFELLQLPRSSRKAGRRRE